MGFFDKMFGKKDTAEKAETAQKPEKRAAAPRELDFVSALSRHLSGDTYSALNAYAKISEEVPGNNLAPFFAAAIKAQEGNCEEAADILRAMSRRISAAGQAISREIVLALVDLLRAEEGNIGVPAVTEVVISFADLLKQEGFVQESAVVYEIAAGLNPDNAHILHKLGDTLHDLRAYEYAESVLQEALKQAPNHWGALYTYAVLLQDLGRYEEAVTYYEQAVKFNPHHARSHNNFGAALMRLNRLDEALAHCKLAAELEPDSPLVLVNLGNIYMLRKEYEKARDSFTGALSLNPNIPPAYFGLATVEQALGTETAKIRDLYLKAIEQNPAAPEFHHALANLLAADGNPEALSHFAAAAKLNHTLRNLHKDWGKACLHLGRREEALDHLRMALLQYPEDTGAQELLAMAEEGKPA